MWLERFDTFLVQYGYKIKMKNHMICNMDQMATIVQNEKLCILTKISLKFVPKGPIDNNPALVLIMAWCWIGDKPLSEPMLTWFTDAALVGDVLKNII